MLHITPQIAENILTQNDLEYIQWADNSQITSDELCEKFQIEINGDLRFNPIFNLIHKTDDFQINHISVVGYEEDIECIFDDLRSPTSIQYVWNGLTLEQNYADKNTLESILELTSNKTPQYSDNEGQLTYTFFVKNKNLGIPF